MMSLHACVAKKLKFCALFLLLAGCTLPEIHRVAGGALDQTQVDGGRDAAQPDDADGGEYNPEFDPLNRNEDLQTFLSLVPAEHCFAEWPISDTFAQAKVQPSFTASDQVVTDNVTKLRWQRVLPDIYPGCTGRYDFVGRLRAVGSGCTWDDAKAYCASPEVASALGGGEWRLPTKIELESILDLSRVNTVDPLLDGFPIDKVWTATPYLNPQGLKLTWAIDFMVGSTYATGRYSAARVRCVSSSGKGGRTPDYDLGATDDTVRDRNTGLEWQHFPDSATRSWPEAVDYCEALELAGAGWRLPSLKELLSIVDPSRDMPSVVLKAFALTASDRFWTATQAINIRGEVFQVDFVKGGSQSGQPSEKHYVRCVR